MFKLIITLVLCLLTPLSYAVANDTTNTGKKIHKQTPFLGVSYRVIATKIYQDYTPLDFGYKIIRVIPGTAADLIGLLADDIIIGIDKEDLTIIPAKDRQQFFSKYIKSKDIGQKIKLIILRPKTRISSNKNTNIESIEQLKNLIDQQNTLGDFSYQVNKTVTITILNAKLGKRANIEAKDIPDNQTLLPEYASYTTIFTDLISRSIATYNLGDDYQDLLYRYNENEQWDNGFRLKLMRYLHRDPVKITLLDDKLTTLELLIKQGINADFNQALANWIDISPANSTKTKTAIIYPTKTTNIKHQLDFIGQIINKAYNLKQQAFASLSPTQTLYIKQQLPLLLTRFHHSLYIDRAKYPSDKKHNTNLINLAKKVNFTALVTAMDTLLLLTDATWLAHIKKLLNQYPPQTWEAGTKAGTILLSNKNQQRYTASYALILDSFGNDIYTAKAGLALENIAVILDLDGNDLYQHTQKYTQAGAFLGLSLLYDFSGDDTYIAKNSAQAFALLGISYLIDKQGNDQYHAQSFTQGTAFWALSALVDTQGDDAYHADLYAQGVGGVKGLGLLLDQAGDDSYFATGDQQSSYGSSGIFKGISQGVGIGFRGYASGGVGILLDLLGKDTFRAGNFSQGVGYFYGIGLIKNAGYGNDNYYGTRYAQGASAHSAIGMLIDDFGDDNYHTTLTAGQSAAWDLSLASLWDKQGNDNYYGTNAFSSHNGFSLFIDSSGYDNYYKISGGNSNSYHGGVSFGIFIDQSGTDSYPDSYQNKTQTMQKKYGLFIDL